METKDIIEFLNKEENKEFLTENGFQTVVEVEKIVETPQELNDELVQKFINEQQGFRDKFTDETIKGFLRKRAGIEEVTPEMLGKKILFEDQHNDQVKAFKKILVEKSINSINPKLLSGLIDLDKIEFSEGNLKGLDEQVSNLKKMYPEQFSDGGGYTPPHLNSGDTRTEKERELEKAKKDMNPKDYIKTLFKTEE